MSNNIFTAAVQSVLAELGLLVKKVDGVWCHLTQDAFRHVAIQDGADPALAASQQPEKLEQLPASIVDAVAAKLDELKGDVNAEEAPQAEAPADTTPEAPVVETTEPAATEPTEETKPEETTPPAEGTQEVADKPADEATDKSEEGTSEETK
jgi:hypothetical protein